ncbi:MAG TPA: glycolate oxidase subunit GlcE [Albitalea sp.]|nr:glycolate oxidase subunit GlcE [Albitalea sp.]HJW11805.1 glycolate oxidase subunit GlcE [Albitalea sp.]
MTVVDPALAPLIERVHAARSAGAQLDIRGGGSKRFYGEAPQGEPFDVTGLSGISSYEPTELVVTARCGTPLTELETVLAEQGQCLPFEPPHFNAAATVGGMVAAGLSGPSRAAVGALRDYVLGATLLNGRGELLAFGGQVMKNVAGYDVSRLLAGSMGTLGVICEVSLKVLPMAPATATLRFELEQAEALQQLQRWGGQPLPINASAWWSGMLVVRLRGALAAVNAAITKLGGELIEGADAISFWQGLREHSDEFFVGAQRAVNAGGGIALWRLSVPPTTPMLGLPGEELIEWGGAQRWLCSAVPAAAVRDVASRAGGHATLFYSAGKEGGVFAPLPSPLDRIHRELKKAFDPAGIFNPGRLYPGL